MDAPLEIITIGSGGGKHLFCKLLCFIFYVLMFVFSITFFMGLPLGDTTKYCNRQLCMKHPSCAKYPEMYAFLCSVDSFLRRVMKETQESLVRTTRFLVCLSYDVMHEAKLEFYHLLEKWDSCDLCDVCSQAKGGTEGVSIIEEQAGVCRCTHCKCYKRTRPVVKL